MLNKIGEEVTEELEYEPGKLFVNKIIRPKYAKPGGEGVIIASMIERPLPKAIAGPGLLAQAVIDKYIDHLPLHRQMERFKRHGVNIAYGTLTDMLMKRPSRCWIKIKKAKHTGATFGYTIAV